MKIGIVGTGHVGSTAAYSLVMQGVGRELVLVDHDRQLADAHVMDIMHATPFCHPVYVHSGDFPDLEGCALVILAAGVGQQPGETRLALLQRNAVVFADIVPKVVRHAADAVLLVATNPLDIMTQIATTLAGLPAGRVLGTGTVLDTARFRTLLGQIYEVAPSSVHAYVAGEHGDSEVLLWSSATVAGIPLAQFSGVCGKPLTAETKEQVDTNVRRAAYRIIDGKGATYYGIGAARASLSRCILYDERAVYTCCSVVPNFEGISNVALSLPHVLGRSGIRLTLEPSADHHERGALRNSAALIRDGVSSLGY
ncbi:MAG: L-lactate dehydrogenase [Pseudomonadota bacterium]